MDKDLLDLYEKGIKSKDEIEQDYQDRIKLKQQLKEQTLKKAALLCIRLTKDYHRESNWILDRIIEQEGETFETKYKKKELESNSEIGTFFLDIDNRKYFKILYTNDDYEIKTHAFVDFEDGKVYKPRSSTSANRQLGWDIDLCLRVADWHGFYLNKDPE